MIVYRALNRLNQKSYVGITKVGLATRIKQHMFCGKSPFQLALAKYGIDAFEITIIDKAECWEELCEKEIYWITSLGCRAPNGYNLTCGGDGLVDPSPEVRERMSASRRGRPSPKKGKPTGLAAWNKGLRGVITHSAEVRRRMSIARAGRPVGVPGKPLSETHRKAISDSLKGKPGHTLNAESRAKIAASLKGNVPWNKGRGFSDEHRANLSASHLGKKQSQETIQKRANTISGHRPYTKIMVRDSLGRIVKTGPLSIDVIKKD